MLLFIFIASTKRSGKKHIFYPAFYLTFHSLKMGLNYRNTNSNMVIIVIVIIPYGSNNDTNNRHLTQDLEPGLPVSGIVRKFEEWQVICPCQVLLKGWSGVGVLA